MRNNRQRYRVAEIRPVLLIAGLGTLLIGCSRAPAPAAASTPEVSSILVEPAALTLAAGHDAWLAAQANDTAGRPIGGAQFRFTPQDPRVLQVSEEGHVTALGPASAQTAVIVASGRQETRVPVVVLPGAPRQLKKLSGDNQQLQAGQAPADPIVARLLDGWNNPVGDVRLTVAASGELFAPSQVISSADGVVQFTVPAITRAGHWQVVLQSPATEGLMVAFHFEVAPGSPAVIDRVPSTSEAGATTASVAPLTLRVMDAHGNPIEGIALKARTDTANGWPMLARTDSAGTATFDLPHGPRTDAVTLEVEAVDSPAVHGSFKLSPDAPVPSHKAHRAG
jgi:hypothetical protein